MNIYIADGNVESSWFNEEPKIDLNDIQEDSFEQEDVGSELLFNVWTDNE